MVENGELRGIITLQTLLSLDRHKWHWLHVASIMERPGPENTVPVDFNAADALDQMHRTGREMLLVANDGKFVGAVNFRDLATFLSITMKIDHNKPVLTSRRVD